MTGRWCRVTLTPTLSLKGEGGVVRVTAGADSGGGAFEFVLVREYVVMLEAPEAALLGRSQFSPPGEFDHIVGAAVKDVGYVFGP